MQIRRFQPQDTEQIAWLVHNTVRQINIQDYSNSQIAAWSSDNIYFRDWLKVCGSRFTYVAVEERQILGFGELESNGHIDCFYVHHHYQRQGIGKSIYQAIEFKAQELNLTRLFTAVSITAKPFFVSQGFEIVNRQQVYCRGETFINYLMTKDIHSDFI
ncbi:MAG: GNAT family N-acetyltransferase [Cyanobacteria bacterium P01_C01_bin.72]